MMKKDYYNSNGRPISPGTRQKEDLFNFFGVLNFKIRKYNKQKLRESFWMIMNRSRDEYFHLLLKSTALFASKDDFILQIVKLSIEANRRNNIRNQTVFKMSTSLNIRLKSVLHILASFSRSRAGYNNRRNPKYYSGNYSN